MAHMIDRKSDDASDVRRMVSWHLFVYSFFNEEQQEHEEAYIYFIEF